MRTASWGESGCRGDGGLKAGAQATPAGLCRGRDAASPQEWGPPHAGLAAELPGRRGSTSASMVAGHSYLTAGGTQHRCDSLPLTALDSGVCLPSQLCQLQEATCFLKPEFAGSTYRAHCYSSPVWDRETQVRRAPLKTFV